jgi:hypothetical protein
MQFFEPNIIVDGHTIPNKAGQERYERSVMEIHQRIIQSAFGRAFLTLIGNNTSPIVIAPSLDRNNADAHALSGRKAFAQGVQVVDDHNNPVLDRQNQVQFGTAQGSTAIVDFTPTGDFRGISADVTLVHELTHAWRQARGRWNPVSIVGLVNKAVVTAPEKEATRFENWEEFLGVVVEDVYAAEQGVTTVRTAHGGIPIFWAFRAPPPVQSPWNPVPLTDSQMFAERYRPALIRIMSEELDLYRLMLASPAWFNPVRDMAGMSRYKESLPPVVDPPVSPMFQGIF